MAMASSIFQQQVDAIVGGNETTLEREEEVKTLKAISDALVGIGDQAREEAARSPLGEAMLPPLARLLIWYSGFIRTSETKLDDSEKQQIFMSEAAAAATSAATVAARAVGNIVIDHDHNRGMCLQLGLVNALLDILSLVVQCCSNKEHIVHTSNSTGDNGLFHELERNVLGALGNLCCDNEMLQEAIIMADGAALFCRCAIFGTAKVMACNAARCLENVKLLDTIAFWHVDGKSDNPLKIDPEITGMALEALYDLTDDLSKLQEMKQTVKSDPNEETNRADKGMTYRSWVESIIGVSGLLLAVHGRHGDFEKAEGENVTAQDKVAIAQHQCSGLLSMSYKIQGPEVFNDLSNTTLITLSRVVEAYCKRIGPSSDPRMFEMLGIYSSVLASTCGGLRGCLQCFDAEAFHGVLAASSWNVDQNKAVRSAGLGALRNLCLACHRQADNLKRQSSVDNMVCPDPVHFVKSGEILQIALNAAQHSNNNLALSGVGLLRQAIGGSKATPAIIESFLGMNISHSNAPEDTGLNKASCFHDRNNVVQWLVSAFQGQGMSDGNKGQCECARIVCTLLMHGTKDSVRLICLPYGIKSKKLIEKMLGCIVLLSSFTDDTLKEEASNAKRRLLELGVL